MKRLALRLAALALSCLLWANAASPEDRWPQNAEALAAFFDPLFATCMERLHVTGAVLAVVCDGEVRYAKGYGSARRGENIPIDPETTLFRVASVSKLFAATAVMQLLEEGKLDLYADVNTYLTRFQIPDTYPEPITLFHLLTHTAGFDDRFLGMAAPTLDTLIPLGAYLAERLPPRVMPPGQVMSYSNHGMALAGYIVEEASGQPFAEYVDEHIFQPLGMARSSFTLVPDASTPLAVGYNYYLGKHHEALYDYPETVPASSLASTASDMARFMIAHLQEGHYGNVRILSEGTARMMHARQFSHHPELPGRAFAFAESVENGQRLLQHTGLIWGFTTLVMLLPEHNAGLFISCTSDTTGVYGAVRSRFLDEFFPKRPDRAPAAVPQGSAERIRRVSGIYRNNRYCRTTFFKFGVAIPRFVSEVHVTAGDEEGTLFLSYAGSSGSPRKYLEIGPLFFRGIVGQDKHDPSTRLVSDGARIAFREEPGGRISHLFVGNSAYERIPVRESWAVLTGAAVFCLAAFLSLWLAWPIAAWWRRREGLPKPAGGAKWAWRLALASSGLDLGFSLGLGLFVLTIEPTTLGYGPPPALLAILVLPLLSVAPTLALVPFTVTAWRSRYWGRAARLHYTLVAAACLLFLALLHYWNLLGFRFG